MSAMLPESLTELKRTPARLAPAPTEPRRDEPRSRRRPSATADDGDGRSASGSPSLYAVRPLRTERTMRRGGTPSYAASLIDLMPVLPTVGTIVSVFTYVGGPTVVWRLDELPLLIGATVTVALGLLGACLHRSLYTAADQAHPRSFAEIRQRVDSLAAQIRVMEAELAPDASTTQRLAFEEANTHYRTLEHDLTRGGPQWVLGTGYVDAMTRLHRAEESLLTVQPTADLLAGALFDETRIAGSTMADREHLLARLRAAVQTLRPSAAAYLKQPPADATADATSSYAADDPSAHDAVEARIVLRDVRRALNDFRDESRARLVRSRCRLLGTITMTGVITYVLLAFAISLDGGQPATLSSPVAAAAAIYLVGAVVGLFNRLHVESADDAASEDYGLAKTRLLLTPMLSGLAAVGGVLITGMLTGIVEVNALTPIVDVHQGSTASPGTIGLSEIFNLQAYPFALLLAAAFGLAPKTFLTRLQKVGEQPSLDLKSTAGHQPAGSLAT